MRHKPGQQQVACRGGLELIVELGLDERVRVSVIALRGKRWSAPRIAPTTGSDRRVRTIVPLLLGIDGPQTRGNRFDRVPATPRASRAAPLLSIHNPEARDIGPQAFHRPPSRICRCRPARLVGRGQADADQGVMALDGVAAALDEAATLLTRARSACIPIIHIKHDAGEGSPYDIRAEIGQIVDQVAPEGTSS